MRIYTNWRPIFVFLLLHFCYSKHVLYSKIVEYAPGGKFPNNDTAKAQYENRQKIRMRKILQELVYLHNVSEEPGLFFIFGILFYFNRQRYFLLYFFFYKLTYSIFTIQLMIAYLNKHNFLICIFKHICF